MEAGQPSRDKLQEADDAASLASFWRLAATVNVVAAAAIGGVLFVIWGGLANFAVAATTTFAAGLLLVHGRLPLSRTRR